MAAAAAADKSANRDVTHGSYEPVVLAATAEGPIVALEDEVAERALDAAPKPRWFTPLRLLIIFCIANVFVYLDRGEWLGEETPLWRWGAATAKARTARRHARAMRCTACCELRAAALAAASAIGPSASAGCFRAPLTTTTTTTTHTT